MAHYGKQRRSKMRGSVASHPETRTERRSGKSSGLVLGSSGEWEGTVNMGVRSRDVGERMHKTIKKRASRDHILGKRKSKQK